MDTYATEDELTARLSDTYTVPANADQLLEKASELINYATMERAQAIYDGDEADKKVILSNATCDQVEFWLEVGEELDVTGLRGALQGGRVQIQNLPNALGQRCKRQLLLGGILWAGVPAL